MKLLGGGVLDLPINLEPLHKPAQTFSDLFRRRVKPGEDDRFWSENEKIAFLDTSFVIEGYLQDHLWAHLAVLKAEKMGLTPFIAPEVGRELKSLEARNKLDKYGIPTAHFWVPNDLSDDNSSPYIDVPESLEDMVKETWVKVSPKYRNYLNDIAAYNRAVKDAHEKNVEPPPPPQTPRISPTDVRILALALLRASKWLDTYVMTSDSDISSVVRALQRDGHAMHVIDPQPPTEEDFVNSGMGRTVTLLTSDVVAQISSAKSDSYVYVLFSREEILQGKIKANVGFKLIQAPFNDKQFYTVPVYDLQTYQGHHELLQQHPRILMKTGLFEVPVSVGRVRLIKGKGDELIDPLHLYKPVKIKEVLDMIIKELGSGPAYTQVLRNAITKGIVVPSISMMHRVDNEYMRRNLPELWQSLAARKAEAEKLV